MRVPFLNLNAQYHSLKQEIDSAIHDVLEASAFAGGPFVEKFEAEFAEFCGVKHAIGVGSGTDALWLALQAAGIGSGDEVITVPNSFIATAEAISLCGATPVFVDIDPATYTMDPAQFAAAITPRTRAVVPVHIFGQTADMDPIAEIAEKHGLLVIEDACQAHGAEYKGRRAGSLGDAGCFSFYPGKNLGAYGEAGAVTTDRDDLAEKVRVLRDHGQVQKYVHSLIGWNARMDGLQGAILSAKLRHLAEANLARRANAIIYRELMSDLNEVALPEEADYAAHVYHIFAIRAPRRDSIIRLLAEFGVTAGIHYPIPIHLQAAYSHMGLKRGAFPVSESCSDSFISLPMFPELSPEQMEYVARGVARALEASDDRFARKAG